MVRTFRYVEPLILTVMNEVIYNLTDGLYDAKSLAEELIQCRDAMAKYFLSCDDEYNKKECWCHYENLTQIVEMLNK